MNQHLILIEVKIKEFLSITYYYKRKLRLLRAAGGKLGKPKHNLKIHLFGGISRRGLTPLVMFTGTMYSKDYQNFLMFLFLFKINYFISLYHRIGQSHNPILFMLILYYRKPLLSVPWGTE